MRNSDKKNSYKKEKNFQISIINDDFNNFDNSYLEKIEEFSRGEIKNSPRSITAKYKYIRNMKERIKALKDTLEGIKEDFLKKPSNLNLNFLKKTHEKTIYLMENMSIQHKTILLSLLQKTIVKFNSNNIQTLEYFNLLTFEIINYGEKFRRR